MNILSSNNQKTRIKKLPPLLINQLSAGEVVTRPASVVKELLENAVDAGATRIEINVTQGGMGLIEIIDDGIGIHPDDMLMAVTRHATSKIANVEHLHGIETLGFRGEALASISAVSRLILTSCHDNSGVGRSLSIAGQVEDPEIVPVVRAQGTTVSVRDLYFNVPARRSNLKSVSTEYSYIEAIIRQIALAYANIELILYHDGKCRLNLLSSKSNFHKQQHSDRHLNNVIASKNSNDVKISQSDNNILLKKQRSVTDRAAHRLKEVLNHSVPEKMHQLKVDLSVLISLQKSSDIKPKIDGWIWLTQDFEQTVNVELPRLIYINNRLVKDPSITQQIRQTIQSVGMSATDIGYALFFVLPSEWLNLNVHPSKQRISIHALANINLHLNNSLKKLLEINVKSVREVEKNQLFELDSKTSKNIILTENQNINAQDTIYKYMNRIVPSNSKLKVANPKTIYNNQNEYTNKRHQNKNIVDSPKVLYRLSLTLENQDSKEEVESLAKILSNLLMLNIKNVDIVNSMPQNKVYKLNIIFSIEYENSIEKLVKLTNKICSPWSVWLIQEKNNHMSVELEFESTHKSDYKNPRFQVFVEGSCTFLEFIS